MKTQEANKLIAEFMGLVVSDRDNYTSELHTNVDADLKYHTSWDWLMPVIHRLKVNRDWIDEEGQKFIDEIDNGLTCYGGILDVHHDVVEAIVNYNEYKS